MIGNAEEWFMTLQARASQPVGVPEPRLAKVIPLRPLPDEKSMQPLRDATELLGEVLRASLDEVPPAQLRRIAAAIIAIGSGPTPEPAWADPRAAALAEAVLEIHGPLLAESRRLHDRVYAAFTDVIWDVPAHKLRCRRASWPLVGVRRKIAAASRTRRAPKMKDALRLLREAARCRAEVAGAQSLLIRHLGAFDRGPMTDVARAGAALAAVIELQKAVGDQLDPRRLEGLLLADAFTAPEVTEPALVVQIELDRFDEPVCEVAAARRRAATAQGLVDHLLARQNTTAAVPS
ncbi:MAG: hypothetical protein QOC92_1808 [Acidimicrobiaceae bacterium]